MRNIVLVVTAVLILGGCTFARISSVPLEIEGVGTVYRYQGRANFSHQIAEADRMMTKHCQGLNGGRPVIVNVQKRDLGTVVIGNGQSTTNFSATATDSPYAKNISEV